MASPVRDRLRPCHREESAAPTEQVAAATKPLSCRSCRQRKVKCNKVSPCGPCERSGIGCEFPRRRKPRIRHGVLVRDEELLSRITRLESLVDKFGGEEIMEEEQERDVVTLVLPATPIPSNRSVEVDVPRNDVAGTVSIANRYVGGHFWMCLVNEVDGLKQLLEQSLDDGEEAMEDPASPLDSNEPDNLLPLAFLFGGARVPLAHPSCGQAEILINTYFYNVDPIFKILHKPTIMALLPKAGDFAEFAPATGTSLALLYSIYFAAVTSLSSADCVKLFDQERDILLAHYKNCTERALTNADFLNSTKLTTLQAFTIYLLCLRSHSNGRSSWTLQSLAVRIAHSLGLHRDGEGLSFSVYDAELRRRLWWQIVVLDSRSAEDRASDPIITKFSFNTKMPSNVNDVDINILTEWPLAERAEPTEMIFCRLSHDMSNVFRRLSCVPHVGPDSSMSQDIQEVENEIKEYGRRIETNYVAKCNLNNPLHRLTVVTSQLLVLKLWLYFWYPQSQQSVRYRRVSRELGLKTAVAAIEQAILIESDPSIEHFRWFGHTFVQWHPLAVALAELCTSAQSPFIDRAWAIIDNVYQKWAERVADTEGGTLWRPIRILYRKAQVTRNNSASESQANIQLIIPLQSSQVPAMETPGFRHPQNEFADEEPNPPQGPPLSIFPESNQLDVDTISGIYTGENPMDWQIWNEFISDTEKVDVSIQSDILTGWPLQI